MRPVEHISQEQGSAKFPLDGWIRRDGYDAVAPSKNAIWTDAGKLPSKISHRAIEKVFDGVFGTVLGEAAAMWCA